MPIEAVAVASLPMASRSAALCFSSAAAARSRSRSRHGRMAVSCDAGASDLLYSSLAAKLLGPPTSFDAGKLTVEFAHSHGNSSSGFPRAYTLTHCDFTANLTLAVSDTIAADRRLRADDVFAEWKQQQQQEGMALHVHCFVSGANLLHGLAAGFRCGCTSTPAPTLSTTGSSAGVLSGRLQTPRRRTRGMRWSNCTTQSPKAQEGVGGSGLARTPSSAPCSPFSFDAYREPHTLSFFCSALCASIPILSSTGHLTCMYSMYPLHDQQNEKRLPFQA
ncbi:Os04g0692600, partial [Oryza sativa Japonica Group]